MGMRWVGAQHARSNSRGALVERFEAMKWSFGNTGTEANTYAINTARAVTGRNKMPVYGRLSWRMDSRR